MATPESFFVHVHRHEPGVRRTRSETCSAAMRTRKIPSRNARATSLRSLKRNLGDGFPTSSSLSEPEKATNVLLIGVTPLVEVSIHLS